MYSLIDIFKKSVILRNNHILERIHTPAKNWYIKEERKMRRNLTGKTALLVLLCMAVMLLTGCGAAAEEPQPTPTATPEPIPVPTPKPTPTPEPETTLQSTQDPIIGVWKSAVFYDESGNPTVDTLGVLQLTVYEDGNSMQEFDGEKSSGGDFTYIGSDDVYDIYLLGLSNTAKYDRDLETLTLNVGGSVAQFWRK